MLTFIRGLARNMNHVAPRIEKALRTAITKTSPMAPDIQLRGSGELLYQIKAKALSGNDVLVFANLIWLANARGEVGIDGFPTASVERLIALRFCARINCSTLLLNPHVAQIGNTSGERGQIRKRFRKLVGA